MDDPQISVRLPIWAGFSFSLVLKRLLSKRYGGALSQFCEEYVEVYLHSHANFHDTSQVCLKLMQKRCVQVGNTSKKISFRFNFLLLCHFCIYAPKIIGPTTSTTTTTRPHPQPPPKPPPTPPQLQPPTPTPSQPQLTELPSQPPIPPPIIPAHSS